MCMFDRKNVDAMCACCAPVSVSSYTLPSCNVCVQCSLFSSAIPRYVSRVPRLDFGFGSASPSSESPQNQTRYIMPGANCQLKMATDGKIALPWEAVPMGRLTV